MTLGSAEIWLALLAAVGGALLGYLGKSRELRLMRQGELRRIYAEFLAAKEEFELTKDRAEEARHLSNSHWEALDIHDEDDYYHLSQDSKDAASRLNRAAADAETEKASAERRLELAKRQIQIQAPRDTYLAAKIYAKLMQVNVFWKDEAYEYFVLLARRDLTSGWVVWLVRDLRIRSTKRKHVWLESAHDLFASRDDPLPSP